MGITPITNLTPLPVSRSAEADLRVPIAPRVENMTRTADETYSPSGSKGKRGAEDDSEEEDDSDDATYEQVDDEDEDEPQGRVRGIIYGQEGSQIDYLA